MTLANYLFEELEVDTPQYRNIIDLWTSIAKNGSPFEKMKVLADAYRDVDHWQTGEFIDWIIWNKRGPIRIKKTFGSGYYWKFEADKWTLGYRGKYRVPGEFIDDSGNWIIADFRYQCYCNLISCYFELSKEKRQKVLSIKYLN